MNTSIDPSNFLKTSTFGIAPAGKTLIINYLKGGGVESNVNTGDLTTIKNIEFEEDLLSISNTTLYNTVKASVAVENLEPAVGGRGAESIEEIRQNSMVNFASQQRNVTQDDYLVRALSMPAKYGNISKAYIEPTKAQSISAGESQSVLDLYVLSYNVNNQLTTASAALKQNISTYLSQVDKWVSEAFEPQPCSLRSCFTVS